MDLSRWSEDPPRSLASLLQSGTQSYFSCCQLDFTSKHKFSRQKQCRHHGIHTVSTVPSIYVGSRSTDLHSPVPPIYFTKSLFHLILSLFSLALLTVAVMLLLTIWMCYLVPVMSYLIVSSICETLSLSPMTLLNAMRKIWKKLAILVSQMCIQYLYRISNLSISRLMIVHVWLIRLAVHMCGLNLINLRTLRCKQGRCMWRLPNMEIIVLSTSKYSTITIIKTIHTDSHLLQRYPIPKLLGHTTALFLTIIMLL